MRAAAGPVRKKMLTLVMLWVAALMTTFALPSRAEGNLLSGKSPSHIQGVSNAKVLTDRLGRKPSDGEDTSPDEAMRGHLQHGHGLQRFQIERQQSPDEERTGRGGQTATVDLARRHRRGRLIHASVKKRRAGMIA